ncbi:hypothetical protein AB1K70_00960 [Bremerella sp. JC770]|uniref:hypothetical protein n=1 Tax=Bremerella sp. JC770 TaxID=3232137 RepID=UPI003457EE87
MALTSLNIPEDPQLLAEWLEALICSDELSLAAVQWEVLAGPRTDTETMTWAETQLAEIDAVGLKSLPEDELRQLMSQPSALLELQEHILAECPPYWQNRLQGDPSSTSADAIWARVESQLDASPASPAVVEAKQHKSPRLWSGLGAVLAIAACLMIGVWVMQPPAKPTGWGFNAPGVLESARSEDELLETLADATHAWFNKRPETREDLELRLKQFDAGCQKLLAAELAPLQQSTHTAVDEICQKTRDAIAGYLVQLDEGGDPLAIRGEADQTVTTLEETLRKLQQTS